MSDRDNDIQFKLNGLLLQAIEGELSEEQVRELNQLIVEHPEMAKHYLEFMNLYSELSPYGDLGYIDLSKCGSEAQKYDLFLQSLADHEHLSPRVETEEVSTEPEIELVQKVTYGDTKFFTLKKASIISLILSTAALILLVLFARFAPQKRGMAVATLIDSLDAEWVGEHDPIQDGTKLVTSTDAYILQAGYAQLRFNNDTLVTVEGPAEFQILTDDQIKLHYGKVYSIVPKQAFGFMVSTPRAKIVDLGTEFGVFQGKGGDTELHVIKGSISLISGGEVGNVNMPVMQGDAKRIAGATGNVESIACDTRLFVRKINSAYQVLWRGQTSIDLADIVGRGNGFGTGQERVGIDPKSGTVSSELIMVGRSQGIHQYCPVPEIPCIDGVFVPLGGREGQVVTSQGHVFKECPETDGEYWVEITNWPVTSPTATSEGVSDDDRLASLGGVQYGTALHPAIMIHSNAGMTFDLDAIRSLNPNGVIQGFTALCGLSDTLRETEFWGYAKVNMYVLIDGEVREMVLLDTENMQTASVDVPVGVKDRFLSLIVTDAGNTKNGDWAVFGDPKLVLEPHHD